MLDNLVGFMLGALEPQEAEAIAEALRVDDELRRQLEIVERALLPLELCRDVIEVPPDLAIRTSCWIQQSRNCP